MCDYRCIADGKIYSSKKIRSIYSIAKYNGYIGTFEEWIKMEIRKGYFEIITK